MAVRKTFGQINYTGHESQHDAMARLLRTVNASGGNPLEETIKEETFEWNGRPLTKITIEVEFEN